MKKTSDEFFSRPLEFQIGYVCGALLEAGKSLAVARTDEHKAEAIEEREDACQLARTFMRRLARTMNIEFRWLENRKAHSFGVTVERKLQYRTRVMTMGHGYQQVGVGDGDTYVASYERPMGWTWTEWQDVPTEIINV